MGMFDTVVCRYSLPHHQDAEFQTKDLAAVVFGEHGIGGFMDDYEVTQDGRLRRHVHEREWTKDPDAPFGGWLRSVRDWWEDVPDAHGDVVIYAGRASGNQAGAAWTEFRLRFTNGRVQDVREIPADNDPARPFDDEAEEPPPTAEPAPDACDLRPEVQELLANLKASAAALRQLRHQCNDHWGYEDPVYRFYHQSFKVYQLQDTTARIVAALEGLRPGHPLHPWFSQIVAAGTGREFTSDDNARWPEATRPVVEAFFHARYFLEMAVRYAGRFEAAPRFLRSGWAALLELYGLR